MLTLATSAACTATLRTDAACRLYAGRMAAKVAFSGALTVVGAAPLLLAVPDAGACKLSAHF